MIDPADDIYIDLRPSCTVDEAVAKLIGWLQGVRRQAFTEMTEDGNISVNQLRNAHSLQGSLEEQLADLRQVASRAFRDAANGGAIVPEIQEKENVVIQLDALIDKAAFYLREIKSEMDKGDDVSTLKIDQHATAKTGEIHLTLKSLDQWARVNNYSSQILESLPTTMKQENDKGDPNEDEDDDTDLSKGGMKKKERSFKATFAFLVEAFSVTAQKFQNSDGSPNVSTIAAHLAKFTAGYRSAPEPAPKDAPPVAGQGEESIKGRIEEALLIRGDKPGWPIKR